MRRRMMRMMSQFAVTMQYEMCAYRDCSVLLYFGLNQRSTSIVFVGERQRGRRCAMRSAMGRKAMTLLCVSNFMRVFSRLHTFVLR
jgi:hypothetical protein